MTKVKRMRPTPALLVAITALVVAMSGAAIALPGKATVSTNDIKKGAITKKLIARGAVGSAQIIGKSVKGNRLKDKAVGRKQIDDGAITSEQVAADGLNSSNIADYKAVGPVRVAATGGVDEASARNAAPKTELFKKGGLTISAKCFRDTTANIAFGEIYVETSANGAIFNGATDLKVGGPAASDFLNTDTLETDRQLDSQQAAAQAAAYNEGEFTIASADGRTQLVGQTSVGVKNGELPGGNGAYGSGNVCLFGLQVSG
ncbi:MAG: hypothetical protein ACJ75R_05505 [Solirubrobacterales bacterium]